MPVDTFETPLPVDAETAWDWHARPGAFRRLAPPWERMRFEHGDEGLQVGARTVFSVKKGPAWIRWEAVHTACEPKLRFVDEQRQGPFAAWRHEHRFEPGEVEDRLVDTVTWKAPGGPLGGLAHPALRSTLRRMFTFRRRRLQHDLARHAAYADRPRLTVAITGATGLVGTALTAFLTTGGHRVIRVTRRPQGPDDCGWDPADGRIDRDALEGVDAVVHLAGASVAERWTPSHKAAIKDSRVRGTRLIVETCKALDPRPRVLISASAVGVYGQPGDAIRDAESPPGEGFLARVGQAWEAAAQPAADAGIRLVIPRIGIVTTAAGGALATMLPAFRAGGGGPIGSGAQWVSWIALDDLVAAPHAAPFEEAWEGPFEAVGPEPIRQREQARILGRVLGRPAVVPLPEAAVRALMGEMGEEMLLGGQRVVPKRLVGWGFTHTHRSFEDAVRFTLGEPA